MGSSVEFRHAPEVRQKCYISLASPGMNAEPVLSINQHRNASHVGALILVSKSMCVPEEEYGVLPT